METNWKAQFYVKKNTGTNQELLDKMYQEILTSLETVQTTFLKKKD